MMSEVYVFFGNNKVNSTATVVVVLPQQSH